MTRKEQARRITEILDSYLSDDPKERDELEMAVFDAFDALEEKEHEQNHNS